MKTQVFEWFSHFKHYEILVDDQIRSGRPLMARTDENISKICEVILNDRRWTSEKIAENSSAT